MSRRRSQLALGLFALEDDRLALEQDGAAGRPLQEGDELQIGKYRMTFIA